MTIKSESVRLNRSRREEEVNSSSFLIELKGCEIMNIKQHLKQNAAFYKDLWMIALPIALQQLVTSSLNMVDTLMVGKVGVDAVAAVGVSNQYYFLLNMVMFGIYSGGMVYFAQFWGKRDVRNIHRLLGFTLVLGIGLAVILQG